MRELPESLIQERTGYKRSMIYAIRRGDRRPSSERLGTLLAIAAEHARKKLVEMTKQGVPTDDQMAVAMYTKHIEHHGKYK